MDTRTRLFQIFVTEIALCVVSIGLAIAWGVQKTRADDFNKEFVVIRCTKEIFEPRITAPLYMNTTSHFEEGNCIYYKDDPLDLKDKDPVVVSPALMGVTVVFWLISICVAIYLKLNS